MSTAFATAYDAPLPKRHVLRAVVLMAVAAFVGELVVAPQIAKLNLSLGESWVGLAATALVVTAGVRILVMILWKESESPGKSALHGAFDVITGRFEVVQVLLVHAAPVLAASTLLLGYVHTAEHAALQGKSELNARRSAILKAGLVSRGESWVGREAAATYGRVRALG
jgi:hypothetical protein